MAETHIQVQTTTSSKEEAEQIARTLLEKHLAACVQVFGPMHSSYRWKGKIERADEWGCVIKTRQERYAEVEAEIKAQHPYEEPEVVAIPVTAGSAGYLDWVTKETSQ